MWFDFLPMRSTTDAIFQVKQLQEYPLAKYRPLYLIFVDMAKAFNRIPYSLISWSLRKLRIGGERLVRAVQAMHKDAVSNECSSEFRAHVGVHKGLVFRSLLLS